MISLRILLILLTCSAIFAQSKAELTKRYGVPVEGAYRVRPGIVATPKYAPTGQIAELVISAETPGAGLRPENMTALLDELVPPRKRGKFVIAEFHNVTCLPKNDCWGTEDHYKKVDIYYNTGTNGTGTHGRFNYIVVTWRMGEAGR